MGLRDINLNNNYISSPIGTSSVKKMEALISKFDPSEIKTTACVNSMAQVYWTIDVINKGFFFNQGDVRFWIGSGSRDIQFVVELNIFLLTDQKDWLFPRIEFILLILEIIVLEKL